MPIYEFECRKCKAKLEVFQKMNDKPPVNAASVVGGWKSWCPPRQFNLRARAGM